MISWIHILNVNGFLLHIKIAVSPHSLNCLNSSFYLGMDCTKDCKWSLSHTHSNYTSGVATHMNLIFTNDFLLIPPWITRKGSLQGIFGSHGGCHAYYKSKFKSTLRIHSYHTHYVARLRLNRVKPNFYHYQLDSQADSSVHDQSLWLSTKANLKAN